MNSPALMIYDDGRGRWGPMGDLRAAFDHRTGALTGRERIEQALGKTADRLWMHRPELAAVCQEESTGAINQADDLADVLCVNGRAIDISWIDATRNLQPGEGITQADGQLLAARLDAQQLRSFVEQFELSDAIKIDSVDGRFLMDRPWHVLDYLEVTLMRDLDTFDLPEYNDGDHGARCIGDNAVRISPKAIIQPGVVFNSQKGVIVIDDNALIGALSIIEGPCYIGKRSQASGHAHIRPVTAVGPVCKVSGEISHTVFQGYANKGHHGYLGHALVGKWVNIGAATNVSNLKNTYGDVRVQLEDELAPEDTGRQFLGPIIGDFVRTGIGTRIMTGSVIGTGSMLASAAFVPRLVQRFSFLTEAGLAMHEVERLILTIRRMMQRRDCELPPALEIRLRELAVQAAIRFNAADIL